MAQTSWTGLLAGSSSPLLASGDVLAFVDVSDTTQSGSGSLVKVTLTNFFANVPVPVVVTSASANALAVGRQGATNPAFQVDSSPASQVAGLKVTGAATTGTVAVAVVTDAGNANLTINAALAGTIGIGSISTGRVTITPVTTITGALTLSSTALVYDGKTLTGSTGTGNMVLSASPTFTGTITAAAANFSGALTAATFGGVTMSSGAVSGVSSLVTTTVYSVRALAVSCSTGVSTSVLAVPNVKGMYLVSVFGGNATAAQEFVYANGSSGWQSFGGQLAGAAAGIGCDLSGNILFTQGSGSSMNVDAYAVRIG